MGLYRVIIEPAGGGKFEHSLPSGAYVFGREADSCDIPIASPEISRRHVQLVFSESHCEVTDLGSTSGTTHEGELLHGARNIPYPFELTLGTCKLSVEQDENTKSFRPSQLHSAAGTKISETPSASSPTPAPAAPAGHYTQGKLLAKGGMGAVMEANDQLLGRTVAMKVILPDIGGSESMRLRFIREATVLARLEHPSIVPIYEMGKDAGGELFYAMKKVEGRTLQAILDDIRKGDQSTIKEYTLDRLLTIFRKICDAMAFAHAKGVIHRDLKPENVMVGQFGEVLVMDWGLAKVLHDAAQTAAEIEQMEQSKSGDDPSASATNLPSGFEELSDSQLRGSSQQLTMDGAVMGSPQYMPPEQADGRIAEIDERSDIFSLGGILYAILTLHPPVEGRTVQEVLENVRSGQIIPPSHYSSDGKQLRSGDLKSGTVSHPKETVLLPHCPGGRVPDSLSAVVMKALALNPDDRYEGVQLLSNDVESYQGGFATSAEDINLWGLFLLRVKRHKGMAILGAAAFVIFNVLVFGFMLKVDAEKKVALVEKQKADEERDRARDAEDAQAREAENARAAEKTAVEALARSSMSLAEAALREGDGLAMQAALDEVPERLRGADWRYLTDQSDTSITNFSSPQVVVGLAPHPTLPHVFALLQRPSRVTFVNVRSGARLLEFPIRSPKHNGCIALSPDGKRLAFGEWDQHAHLQIHDARTGKLLKTWKGGHAAGLAFSPDGERLLQWRYQGNRELLLWDPDSGKLLWSAPSPNVVTSVSFTADGRHVYVHSGDQLPELRRIEDGQRERTLGDYRAVKATALHPAGDTLIAAGWQGEAIGHDLKTDHRLFTIRAGNGAIQRMAFTSDGRRFVTLQFPPNGAQELRLWDVRRGNPLQRLLGGVGEFHGMAVHPVSGELFTHGANNAVWDLAPPLWTFEGSGLGAIAFWTEDIVLAPKQGKLEAGFHRLLEPGTTEETDAGMPPERKELGMKPNLAEMSRDGSLLILGRMMHDIPLRMISRKTPDAAPAVISLPPGSRTTIVRISPDNRRLAFYTRFKRKLYLPNLVPGQAGPPMEVDLQFAGVNDLAWVSTDRLVGLLTKGGSRGDKKATEGIVLWDAETGKVVRETPHSTAMDTLAISPDGKRFAEAGGDKRVRIRDAESLEILEEFRVHDAAVTAIAWHPSLPILVTGSDDLTIRFWDLNTKAQLDRISGVLGASETLVFSPSGRRLGSASEDGRAYIWEPRCLNPQATQTGPTAEEKDWFGLCPLTQGLVDRLLQRFPGLVEPGESAKLDAAIPAEAFSQNQLEHPLIIERHGVALVVPGHVLDRKSLRPRQQLLDAFIGIIALARLDPEIARVRQGSTTRMVHLGDHLRQPIGVAGQTAVVLDDHIETLLRAQVRELRESVGREFDLLLPRSKTARVHPDRMAAQEFCGVQPLAMVVHGLLALGLVGFPQIPFAIAHDEQAFDAQIGGALLHLAQVGLVLRLVHEELIHIFDCLDPVIRSHLGKIQVVDLAGTEVLVDGPLGQ